MDRRQFLKLSGLAVPGAIVAANAGSLPAATAATRLPLYKGFGTSARTTLAVQQMLQLDLDWFYTWGKVPNLGQPVSDFTPMVWGAAAATSATIAEIQSKLWKTGSTRLLGFNEPDHPRQANMSVDRALQLWPILERTSLKLGSPATISPNVPWMIDFMTKAKRQGRRVDFVAVHIYQYPNAKTFFRKIDETYERWGKPVWITETAVADWDATPTRASRYSRAQVNDYMREIYAGCRNRAYVQRFAWKTRAANDPEMGTSSLFNSDGTLSSTGRLYASL